MTDLEMLRSVKYALDHSGGTPWGQAVQFTTEEFHAVLLLVKAAIREMEAHDG